MHEIPDVRLPFALRLGRFADSACADGEWWVAETNLFPDPTARTRMFAARTGELASAAFPDSPEDLVQLVNRWILWTLAVDDHFDRHTPAGRVAEYDLIFGHINGLLTGNPFHRASSTVTRALGGLWDLTAPQMPSSWQKRFLDSTLRYIRSMRTEAAHMTAGQLPTIGEYILLRRETFWCHAATDLVAFAEQMDIPGQVYHSEEYQALCDAAADIGGWTNDLFTAEREIMAGETLNLPGLLMQHQQLGLAEALTETARMVQGRVKDFADLYAAVTDLISGDRGLLRCVDGIRNWVVANHEWHRRSLRYGGAQ